MVMTLASTVNGYVWKHLMETVDFVGPFVTGIPQSPAAIIDDSKPGSDLILLSTPAAISVLHSNEQCGIRLYYRGMVFVETIADRVFLISNQRYNEVLQSLIINGVDTAVRVVDEKVWRLGSTTSRVHNEYLDTYAKALRQEVANLGFVNKSAKWIVDYIQVQRSARSIQYYMLYVYLALAICLFVSMFAYVKYLDDEVLPDSPFGMFGLNDLLEEGNFII